MSNQKAASAVQAVLDNVTSDPKTGIPGLVFASINKNGELIQVNASGKQGVNTDKPMSEDTIFCIFSCTKLITTIAALQLVEQGKLKLDDAEHLKQVLPELAKVQVLGDNGELRPRKNDITLRQLLAHTAGFGYEFFNEKLRDYGRKVAGGFNVFDGDVEEIYRMPLVNEPGTAWEYGINIDWAGIAVERVSGQTLDAYFQQHIFGPLGLKNITMFPTQSMKDNLAPMHQRDATGNVYERDHLNRRVLFAWTDEEKNRIFNSGGAGCFAKPTEYIQILAALLNNGTSAKTGAKILSRETVDAMFQNQIPDTPDFSRQGIPASKKDLTNPIPDVYPQPGNPAQGWGLSFHLTLEPSGTGRSANTGWWAGISNLFFWVDREKGVAGMIASQLLPFADMPVLGAWVGAEKAVYDNL